MGAAPRKSRSKGEGSDQGLKDLQSRLNYQFVDETLLLRALTHRSWGAEHNERLEFLGDAVLSLAVSHTLYHKLSDQPEGALSRVRAKLVCESALHELAKAVQLPQLLRLGQGERHMGGNNRASILADAMEAVIGAVFLDGGWQQAQALVALLFAGFDVATDKDSKTALQEWLQASHQPLPQYEVVQILGPEHQQTFVVKCTLASPSLHALGQASSRRLAEQNAAALVLAQLGNA